MPPRYLGKEETVSATTNHKMMHEEIGTKKPCRSCKWQIADPTNPLRGQCTVNRTPMGGVWKRWVTDVNNMTCGSHEVGKLSFREHV
ncbi:benzylsuccinate synthase beta subunit family protein [Desulfuromonas sp. TF]|uniref:benzylsuccinate synthase beta subunit family protein n=1 Tax=Desulfuromonas sp. TF TaxID=1232410 RepID=UPI00138ABCB8